MNETQRAADVIARAAWLNAQVAAMQAENLEAITHSGHPCYTAKDFEATIREVDLRPDLIRQFLVHGVG